jgi:hypothetical protein
MIEMSIWENYKGSESYKDSMEILQPNPKGPKSVLHDETDPGIKKVV